MELPYDAVIFDLDGTLTESEPGIVKSVQYALERLGRRGDPSLLRSFIGPPLLESFMQTVGMDEEEALTGVEFYRERFREVGWRENAVYEGIPAMLRTLKARGVYLAVATAKPAPLAERILAYFGLNKYFDLVAAPDLSDHHSDKAVLVRRALPDRFHRACMVGDRRYDICGALANRIGAVGALYGYGGYDELSAAGATFVAESVEALARHLLGGAPLAPGRFITLEGSDGCGKSTQVKPLERWLRQCGHRVTVTREPGGCPIAERVRKVVLDAAERGMTDECEALLFAAARAQHVHDVIAPALSRGDVVLCDRFVDSSIAYQGIGRGLGEDLVRAINAPAVKGYLPDITLLLQLDPFAAMRRRQAADSPDRIEAERASFVRRVYEGYQRLMQLEPERFVPVDAEGSAEEVARRIQSLITPLV